MIRIKQAFFQETTGLLYSRLFDRESSSGGRIIQAASAKTSFGFERSPWDLKAWGPGLHPQIKTPFLEGPKEETH